MRGLLAAVLLTVAIPRPAVAQDLWGTTMVPGGIPATRVVMQLGGDAGRIDEFLLVDFAHRFHASPDHRSEAATFGRYVTLLERISAEASAWPSGFVTPTAATPRPDRDRARQFLGLLGLVLDNNQRISIGRSSEARERQAWLLAAGVDTAALVDPLNAGSSVTVTIPQGELPLPLPQFWSSLAGGQSPLLTITGSRESAFVYAGLLHVDSQTLAYLATRPVLLEQLRARHSGPFAAFARSLRIHNGSVVVPGGAAGTALWERLVGEPLTTPDEFVPALLSKNEGSLAWFLDAVTYDGVRDEFDEFLRMAPQWKIREQPFSRPHAFAAAADLDAASALTMTLARLGITDPALVTQTVAAVRNLDDKQRGSTFAPLARWQMMLALIEQITVRRRLGSAETTPLVRSLVDWAAGPDANAEGRAAVWLVDVLLPALAPAVATDDLEVYERDVIVAVTKRHTGERAPPAVKVFWEGLDYIVDDTFATTRDVLTIRMSQRSPALGDIIRLRRVVQQLEAGAPDLAKAEAIAAELTRVLAAMSKLRAPDERELKVLGEFRKAERGVRDISNEREAGSAVTQLPRLRAALDALVDGGVLPLVYAMAVSPSGPSPSTLLDMPYWHTWKDATWQPARRQIGPYMESLIRGSVLGLDLALAETRLRPSGKTNSAQPDPVMAYDIRQSILHTMRQHGEMPVWGEDAARILKALADGTAELNKSADIAAATEERFINAGIDPARINIVRWQRLRGVPADGQAFTRLDAYHLGSAAPLPQTWVDDAGSAEVLLRLLETTRDLRLPAGIIPTLLPLATHDWLTHVRQYGDDDMRSVTEWPRTITRERVEAYMLGLVSARMLVRPPRSQQP